MAQFGPINEGDCGQQGPLSRLAAHLTHDHTFSESHGHAFPDSSDQLVEQFLTETRSVPQSFQMDELVREMQEIESQNAIIQRPASRRASLPVDDSWAQQYIDDGNAFPNTRNEAIWAEIDTEEAHLQPGVPEVNQWLDAYLTRDTTQENQEQAAINEQQYVYSKLMRFMDNREEDGEEQGKLTADEVQSWSKEFFDDLAKSDLFSTDGVENAWTQQWNLAARTDDEIQSEVWDNLRDQLSAMTSNDFMPSYTEITPVFKDYVLSEDNPMALEDDPLQVGKRFRNEGDYPNAVLCFEAAVKKEPENAEGWYLLGKTQSDNEKDPSAISALMKCLQLDPNNLNAMMALSIAYANEGYHRQSANMLVQWLASHPKYADLVPKDFRINGQVVSSFLHVNDNRAVKDMFIKAALRQPGDIDFEVQCCLGILFSLSEESKKASDCFQAALSVQPDNAVIWNHLGATLANGFKFDEALSAYHRALELRPGFIRARFNIAVTCINMFAFRQAAEHLLTALNLQANIKSMRQSVAAAIAGPSRVLNGPQMSETIWITLRMAVSMMERSDLATAVDNRDLDILNREFNITDF